MSRCTEIHAGCFLAGEMAEPTTVRIDPRAALPVAVFALVVFIIIFVQLCGTEDVKPLGNGTPLAEVTRGPTFTPGPGATAAPGRTALPTPTAVPQVGGDVRDAARIQDLTTIQQKGLAPYKAKNGKYPDTGGGIQTLCNYTEFDKGCALKDVFPGLPNDPLGDPAQNGYWYKSDGNTYTLYARRDSNVVPECAEHPQHLNNVKSVMCVSSP